jgi:hypothetical protein
MLGALGACGFGFGAILFGFVKQLPFGWRALYLVGVFPLLVLPALRRGIPETERFARHRRTRLDAAPASGGLAGWRAPLLALGRACPRRVAGITLAGAPTPRATACSSSAATSRSPRTTGPWRFSLMVVLRAASVWSATWSRDLGDASTALVVAVLASLPSLASLFYSIPGCTLPILWAFLTVCSVSCNVTIRALATEVFPTSHRGTSGGWLSLVQTLGTAAGLGVVGLGIASGQSLPFMVSLLAVLVVAGSALFLLPETNRRELEEISDEHA